MQNAAKFVSYLSNDLNFAYCAYLDFYQLIIQTTYLPRHEKENKSKVFMPNQILRILIISAAQIPLDQ